MSARNCGQFAIEHAGEGEQGVAPVLQRDAHRADAPGIRGFALRQLLDEEVEQRLPGGQGRAGQRQNVMAQPLGERPDVAGQLMRLSLGHLGGAYLDLLRFFLNHRRFLRSRYAQRLGKSPRELMTGQGHPRWLTLLGLGPLQPQRA